VNVEEGKSGLLRAGHAPSAAHPFRKTPWSFHDTSTTCKVSSAQADTRGLLSR
jgi:hypothetical protein